MTSRLMIAEYDDGDLLRANPNHTGKEWQDQEDESEAEVDDVETLISGVEQTRIS